jgi:hypothetical protein
LRGSLFPKSSLGTEMGRLQSTAVDATSSSETINNF